MKRRYLLSWAMAGWMLAGLAAGARGTPGAALALLRGVAISSPASSQGLLLRIQGDYAFQAVQTAPDRLSVSLQGVRADSVAPEGQWGSGVVSGYRLVEFREAGTPGLRVEMTLRQPQSFRVERDSAGLHVLFGPATAAQTPAAAGAPAGNAAEAATAAPRYHGTIRVQGVSIQAGDGGQTLVDIATSHPATYRVFELGHPQRLVLDFEDARSATRRHTFEAHAPLLSDVRVGLFQAQNPPVVRVVADLAGDPLYEVHPVAGGVRITLRSHQQAVPAAGAAPPNSKAVPEAPSPSYQKVLPQAAGSTVAAAPRAPSSAANPEAEQATAAARTMAANTVSLPLDVQQPAPGSQTQEPAAASQGQEAAPAEQPRYSGEPISVNLKNVDLKDFFRLIHEISGLNIIVDPDVTGSVTMVLTDVPWDQALDIVLKDNGLGKVLEGNVLRIAKVSTLTAEQAEVAKLAEARVEAQPLVTRFVPINYAKASNISTMLKSWAGGGALTKRGSALVDDRTNTLIVSDVASQVPVILGIIKKLDTKAKQVAIEARVELVTHTFARNLAAALSVSAINKAGSTVEAGQTGTGSSATTSTSTFPTPSVALPSQTLSGFGVYAISNVGARYIINGLLAAEESKARAQTISRPSIVTQNNIPGTVTQGTQIPIQTTINNTISIQYVQASLTLNVTPQVTADGNIFLVITVTNSSVGVVLTSAGPSINTQQATTQVLVPDGGTVIFGGVSVAVKNKAATYVPLLGQIPILGNLFKSSSVSTNDTELLFFVSPKILPS